MRVVLRGKFIALQAYLKKQGKISNKQSHPSSEGTRKENQTKHRLRRRKKIINIGVEINDIETEEQHKRSVKPRADSLK